MILTRICRLSPHLARAFFRLIVNEMKGTVWTSTGMRPDGVRAGPCGIMMKTTKASYWQDARDPLTTRAANHPLRYRWRTRAISSASFRKGLKSHAGYPNTSRKSLTTRPAGLPAIQAASCLLCIPQRSIHLLRVLESDSTKEFLSFDETVLKAVVGSSERGAPESFVNGATTRSWDAQRDSSQWRSKAKDAGARAQSTSWNDWQD